MPDWGKALEITSLTQARTLLQTLSQNTVLLKSPERALITTGSNYWLALLGTLRAEFPHLKFSFIIDAGDAAGLAQGAIADGHAYIRFTGGAEVKEKLQQIATMSGGMVL